MVQKSGGPEASKNVMAGGSAAALNNPSELIFSNDELRDLAARASTIDERLAGGYVVRETSESKERAARRFDEWCKSAADGDFDLLETRLERGGHDPATVRVLFGEVRLADSMPTPPWVDTFRWVVEALQSADAAELLPGVKSLTILYRLRTSSYR